MASLRIIVNYLVLYNLVSAMSLDLQNPSDQTCTYTFNVPREGEACLPGSQQHDRNSLETLITNQHALLEQQLKLITEKLVRLEQNLDNTNMDNDSLPSVGTGGTTYVRWGRTICPETASDIYQGKSIYNSA